MVPVPVPGVVPPDGTVPPERRQPPAEIGTPVPPAPLPSGPNPPEPEQPAPERRESGRAPSGDSKEPPVANVPSKPAPPSVEERRDVADSPPIDVPNYHLVVPNVATGLKPYPSDGLDWLKKKGFKTVLHLRQPGEDDAAVRRLFEKKGFRFISLEASPARLDKELYERFVALVTDTNKHPLYVFDKDASVASGLWYLYFRVHLKQSDEQARPQAQRLGMLFDEDPEHKAMWLAVQKLLEKLKP
jgi:hypothetical protein